jgi:hypothetical protein
MEFSYMEYLGNKGALIKEIRKNIGSGWRKTNKKVWESV